MAETIGRNFRTGHEVCFLRETMNAVALIVKLHFEPRKEMRWFICQQINLMGVISLTEMHLAIRLFIGNGYVTCSGYGTRESQTWLVSVHRGNM